VSTGLVQHSSFAFSLQSLSALHVFAQLLEQMPLQQSSWKPEALVQSLSWVQVAGQVATGRQAPVSDALSMPLASPV
jgi:hypothetical protein